MLSNQSQTHTNVQIATNVSTLDSLATAQNDPSKSKENNDHSKYIVNYSCLKATSFQDNRLSR
ncbi:hypothetical protein [Vibrio lentus]|uniref:hypothetical protein n=1 Tax=Vibrio lentus TaxID=136468 RepID=UPI0010550045|nr:hypothetical protein [Vibrio lentus]